MKRILAFLLTAALVLGLCACGTGGDSAGGSTWVTYEAAKGSVQNPEGKDIFNYSYQQPVLSADTKGAAMVNTKLDNATTAFLYGSGGVEALAAQARTDWQQVWFTGYTLTREVSAARVDSSVASFRYADYSFTGGVHGYMAEYGMNYDMATGAQLVLRDLGEDEWALKEVCRQYIIGILHGEDFSYREGLLPDYLDALDTVLENWVFTQEGLQFIAQPYIIAAYAVGTLRFTVPYTELLEVLDSRWWPEDAPQGSGSLTVREVDMEEPAVTSFVLAGGGETLTLQVTDTVYDFSVEEVNSYTSEGNLMFYIVQQHLYSPCISNEVFALHLPVPEGVPTMLLRYQDGVGTEYQYYVSYNGKTGGIHLAAADPQLTRE